MHRALKRGFVVGFIVLIGVFAATAFSQEPAKPALTFDVAAMGQTVAGVIDVLDAAVTMEIELPGVIGMIAGGLKDRLQKVGQLLLTKE